MYINQFVAINSTLSASNPFPTVSETQTFSTAAPKQWAVSLFNHQN